MKISRYQLCPCGSGKIFELCCINDTSYSRFLQHVKLRQVKVGERFLKKEIDYICSCVKNRESMIVSLGHFITFSTESGDAFLLDPEELNALCLMNNFVKQKANIQEGHNGIIIPWTSKYNIEDENFILYQQDNKGNVCFGYPATELAEIILQMKAIH